MKRSYKNRPKDFKRRIIKSNIEHRPDMYIEEQKWLNMIRQEEISPHTKTPRYYNLNTSVGNLWHQYDGAIKTIGAKISASKKGKKIGPCSPEKAKAISEAKKKGFASRGGMTEEHKRNLKEARIGLKRSEESKQKTSNTLKDKWKNEWQDRKIAPKETMSRAEQDALCSMQLKERWADPVWAANQKARLSEGAKNRPPRSEESKLKASLAQKGKSKKKA
jgi:hypothetical protein